MSKKKKPKRELTHDLIRRAVSGNAEAVEEILRFYDGYINTLATYEAIDESGEIHKVIDEDVKIQLQCRLIEGIKKWKVVI